MTAFPKSKRLTRRGFLKSGAAGASVVAMGSPAISMLGAPAYASGNSHLNFAIGSEPPSLDPQTINQNTPRQATFNIYEALVDRADNGEIVPRLATSWERIDPTTTRFVLRQGVKFHNGADFNADSAVFSINRILDPVTKSQWIGDVRTIKEARKVDDYTIDVINHEFDPILLSRIYVIGMMDPAWTEEMGKNTANDTNGTGPYQLREWQRNVVVELDAFEGYWGEQPEVRSASLFIIGEDSTRYQMIRTGELDVYLGPLPDHLPDLPNYRSGLAQSFSFIRFSNMEGSKVLDPRVRQAMNYAVNKQVILDQLHLGEGKILPGQISSEQMFGFNPNLQPYEYDLDRAKSLVREAGAEGLEIDIVGPKGRYSGDSLEVQAIAGMIEDSGLKVDLSLRDVQSWVRIGDRNQTPQPPSGWYVRHENFLFDADRTVGGYYSDSSPFSSYHNDKIRGLMEMGAKEQDVTTRESLYQQCFEIGRTEDPTALFLLQHVDLWAMSNKASFTPRPDGSMEIARFSVS